MAVSTSITDQNLSIVLNYFRPIAFTNPVTDDLTPESNKSSSNDGDINKNNFFSLVEKYGIDGTANIFNSIKEYPVQHMMKLFYIFKEQLEKVTEETYKQLLRKEIEKLRNLIIQRAIQNRKLLVDVFLESLDYSDTRLQKAMSLQFLSVACLIDIVLRTKSDSELMKQKDALIKEKEALEIYFGGIESLKNNQFKTNRKKIRDEATWDYVEKLVNKIEPNRSECVICQVNSKDYIIVDCSHYCLCEHCKILIEETIQPKCPLCRMKITEMIKVY